jgi:hypothetical protein
MSKMKKAIGTVLSVAFALTLLAPAARASMRDQATEFTFGQPVQVPGCILPAGTYHFVVSQVPAERNTVQIFSSDWSRLYATVQTVPVERDSWAGRGPWEATGQITLAQGPSGRPAAIVDWFYAGRVTGHEFVYPSREENQLKPEAHQTVDLVPAG